jgi:hypothetical protein
MPGRAATSGPMRLSSAKRVQISAGTASRSNIRLSAGVTRASSMLASLASSTKISPSAHAARSNPLAVPKERVRAYASPETTSTPGMARGDRLGERHAPIQGRSEPQAHRA